MAYTGYERFTWRGEPIHDIQQWCRERGEALVSYHAERMTPSPWPTVALFIKDEYDSEMPESFWSTLAITDGWRYTELSRRLP